MTTTGKQRQGSRDSPKKMPPERSGRARKRHEKLQLRQKRPMLLPSPCLKVRSSTAAQLKATFRHRHWYRNLFLKRCGQTIAVSSDRVRKSPVRHTKTELLQVRPRKFSPMPNRPQSTIDLWCNNETVVPDTSTTYGRSPMSPPCLQAQLKYLERVFLHRPRLYSHRKYLRPVLHMPDNRLQCRIHSRVFSK